MTIGDTIEILYPNKFDIDTFKIEKLYDIKTDEEIETVNPGVKGQLVKLKIPYFVEPGTILRRKK